MINLIPEKYFPLRKKPDVDKIVKELKLLKIKVKKDGYCLSTIEKDRIIDLTKKLKEIQRRLTEEYIYYFKPNPVQMKFVCSVIYGRILRGGNKVGKTEVLIYDYVLKCLGEHPAQKLGMFRFPPVEARIICPDFQGSMQAKMIPVINKFLPPKELLRYHGDTHTFYLRNGSLLELKSNEQEVLKFASVDRDLIGMDEPIRKDIFGENLTRLATRRGSWDMTQTPEWSDKRPWVKREILYFAKQFPEVGIMKTADGKDTEGRGITEIRGCWKDNKENLDPIGVQEWLSTLTSAERKIRETGDFPEGSSILFGDSFIDGIHTCKPFKVPWKRDRFCAIDMGIGCPTVCLWGFVGCYEDRFPERDSQLYGKEPIIYIYREYYERGKTIPENASNIQKLSKGEAIQLSFLDPKSGSKRDEATGLTRQMQWRDAGIPTILGAINVESGLNEIASMMLYGDKSPKKNKHPRLVIFSNCFETIKEMRDSSVDDLKRTDAMHCISCLRWLVSAKLLETWGQSNATLPGAFYSKKEYNRKYCESY